MEATLAIGWDVGGWLGHKQAVAVARVSEDGTWQHVGRPVSFRLSEVAVGADPLDLARIAWPEAPRSPAGRVVVAIDAPLAFPSAFVELLAQGMLPVMTGTREIDNPLAYRDCDRFIARTHGKKPLSASFDKLGNNATVAMTVTRRWRAQGFRVVPFDDPGDGRRLALETYPALFKRAGVVVERARALLPRGLHDGTDEQDAALCALAAVAYSGAEDSRLPKLVPPPSGEGKDGWIFGPTRAWFDDG